MKEGHHGGAEAEEKQVQEDLSSPGEDLAIHSAACASG